MKSSKLKKMMSCIIASAMALSATACGDSGDGTQMPEYVYVPEYQELNDENASFYNMKYVGGALYYGSYSWDEATGPSQSIVKYSLEDGSTSAMPIELGESRNLNEYAVAGDGSIYAACNDYSGEPGPDGNIQTKLLLFKFGADGTQEFSKDLTEALGEDAENSYVQSVAVDSENRCYLSLGEKILLTDAEGNYQGIVDTGTDWINGMGSGKDGKVYFCYYDYNSETADYLLAEVDFDKKAVGGTYKNFMGGGNGIYAGTDYDFLLGDSASVYGYSLKTQKSEKIFDWLDSDINGSYATCVGQTQDGKYLAVVNDWENEDNSIALLTKTKSSEVAPRETIVIGTMYNDSLLQSAAVKFNKSNDKYRISIRTYMDNYNWSESAMSDALTRMNNDITSNNCPDMLDLGNINVQRLAAKGVFEDLNPYLEGSSLNRGDFVDSVMEAFTYDGVLVGIPARFELRTLMGKASDLGDKEGWTIDEMIAYADAHPDAELLDDYIKDRILELCLTFNENTFIDWGTGECKFDTPEFKSLLEFASRFPDEYEEYEEGAESTPTKIQNGDVLLDSAYISDFNEIQLYKEVFGNDLACIGYPTTDGGSGTGLMASQAYAITAKSGQKEGAWAFIESILTPEEDDGENQRYRYWGFPNNKGQLKAMAEEAVKEEYLTDENGEIMMDENGEAIVMGAGGGIGYEDGWHYEYRTPTQDEVDIVMGLIERARNVSLSSNDILNIIKEEAAGFFQGQKSVDEVTEIIQSRINIYVNENS